MRPATHVYTIAMTFALSLFLASSSKAQIEFQDRSDLLDDSSVRSGVAMAVVDMNGDLRDDIVRFHRARTLSIEYQTDPGSEFTSYVHGTVSSSNQWSVCVGDVDGNGFNDILCGGAYDGLRLLFASPTGATYDETVLPGPNLFVQGSNFVDINRDGILDIFACHDDAESHKYRGLGFGRFSFDASLIDTRSSIPSDNSGNYGSIWTDYNNDGRLDLYISKCRQSAGSDSDPRRINLLFRNDGNTFTEVAPSAGLAIGAQSWTTDFADIDNDGDLDCFVVNHYDPSSLYRNNGNGTFTNITSSAFVSGNIDLFGIQTLFRDLDNDGFVDLLITGSEHRVFRNNGNRTFSVVSNPSLGSNWIESMAVGDLDDDGYLDVYAGYANLFNSPSSLVDRLFLNTGSGSNFFKVHLKGKQSGSNGIGARIEIDGAWGTQIREVRSGESYGISNSFTQHFGLGSSSLVDRLVVRWPSGVIDELTDIDANQLLVVEEGSTLGFKTASDFVVDRSDDAEEASNGEVSLSGNDLELIMNGADPQTVGIRFSLDVPRNATITEAHIQFASDEVQFDATQLIIQAHDIGDSPAMTRDAFNLSSRTRSSAQTQWVVPPWTDVGLTGGSQRTPNLRPVVQEIVNRSDWNPSQHVLFLISGNGRRTAESYNGSRGLAPHLRVAYTTRNENHPPTVSAGEDMAIGSGQSGFLHALIADEGGESITWTQISGPGTALFQDVSAALTQVNFTAVGTYGLRVTVDDGDASASDDIFVTVLDAAPARQIIALTSGFDDAEERDVGSVSLRSADLELVNDGPRGDQLVGCRFYVPLEMGVHVLDARIQFTTDEVSLEDGALKILTEDIAHAEAILSRRYDLSRRLHGGSWTPWSPPSWPFLDASGPDQRTPNLIAQVQPLIDREDWSPGNAMMFLITGTGTRTAESFDGSMAKAPKLQLISTSEPINLPPRVDAGLDRVVSLSGINQLDGTVYDALGATTNWTQVSGPADATIADPSSPNSGVSFTQSGCYRFRMSVSDGLSVVEKEIFLTVISDATTCVSAAIIDGNDDAEESSSGDLFRRGADLELVDDGSRGSQTIGLRFTGLSIPQGAEIVSAYIQFTADETASDTCSLTIHAEDVNDSAPIASNPFELSTRAKTLQSASWNLGAWAATGESGSLQRSPDISHVLEEVVQRGGWQPQNALMILITGNGTRTAESFEGAPSESARLHIEYR